MSFERACGQRPTFAMAHYNLASVHNTLGNHESAIIFYKKSIRLAPRFAPAHYELALLYLELGNRDDAFAEYLVLNALNKKLSAQLLEELSK